MALEVRSSNLDINHTEALYKWESKVKSEPRMSTFETNWKGKTAEKNVITYVEFLFLFYTGKDLSPSELTGFF